MNFPTCSTVLASECNQTIPFSKAMAGKFRASRGDKDQMVLNGSKYRQLEEMSL